MTPFRVDTSGPGETRRLGRRLGRLLRPGDVVLLSGELGAGKTVFVQGLARGMRYAGAVASKSFVLLGEYAGRRGRLYHADLYRLESPEQASELGLEESLGDGALAVEWPERGAGAFPDDALSVLFEVTGERSRRLTIESGGSRSEELLRAMAD